MTVKQCPRNYNFLLIILQIPAVKDTKDFISAWGKFMQEVTEVMLEITAHGHTR